MNQRYWRSAYGTAPEDFHLRLVDTLDGLEEREMKKRYKFSTVLVAAAIMALLAGGALAASQLGVFHLMTDRVNPIMPLEGAEEMVLTGLGATENELVTVTLEEALYDGQGALVQIHYAAKDPEHYALLSDGLDFEYSGDYDIRQIESEDGYTYEMVAGRLDGKQDISCGKNIAITDDAGGEILLNTWDGEMQEDGSIVLWGSGFSAKPLSENVTLTVNASTVLWGSWDDEKQERENARVEIDPITVPMERLEAERQVRYVPMNGGEGERFQIHSVEISFTKLCAYLTVDYSYQQAETGEEMGIDFILYSEDGERITTGGGEWFQNGERECRLIEMQSFEEEPERLWLEAKVIGENVTLGRVECRLEGE